MYTYAANVWDLSLVQGPFSVAPRPNLRVPIRVHFFVAGEGFTALSECVVLPPTYVDSALWPAWLRIALTEPVFLHFTTAAPRLPSEVTAAAPPTHPGLEARTKPIVPAAVMVAGACRSSVSASASATTEETDGPVPPYSLGKRNGRKGTTEEEQEGTVALRRKR